jgi:hypothetical protein
MYNEGTWGERVDPWKMSRTPGRRFKSLWEPKAEPGMEGSPNQSSGEPRVDQGREEESGRNALRNIPTQDAGWRIRKFETTLRRPTPIQSLGGRYPRFQRPFVTRRGFFIGWRTNLPNPTPVSWALLTPSPPIEFSLTLQPS